MHNLIYPINQLIILSAKKVLNKIAYLMGYSLVSRRNGYMNRNDLLEKVSLSSLSVCDYLEQSKAKESGLMEVIGRRDRIVNRMLQYDSFSNSRSILEIGPGAGIYTEKIITSTGCTKYQIYELNPDWEKFLVQTYRVKAMYCNGYSLASTKSNSIDLIHAHAVFVYLPMLTVFDYIKEALRCLKPDGLLVFNVFTENTFPVEKLIKWQESKHRFPVLLPEKLLSDYLTVHGGNIIDRFTEIYGEYLSEYFVIRKAKSLICYAKNT